ncbi:MAG: endonuclease/exonuclease/phosphatase family protein, partial [Sphingobacterium sp.]
MILGGDLNTPSHLDWGKNTKKIHHNLVVPWYSTKVLADIGLVDTYRTLNPNPITHPGITWHTKGEN